MRLRITTLNTWGLPWPISSLPRARRYPAIERYLKSASFDIVALQEVWGGAPDLDVGASTFSRATRDGRSGLAIAVDARHALVDTAFVGFGARPFMPWVEKGVLHARVRLGHDARDEHHARDAHAHDAHDPRDARDDAHDVHMLVTHLQAYAKSSDARARAAQMDAVLARAEGARDAPCVLLGDFNFYHRDSLDRDSLDDVGAIDDATVDRIVAAGFVDALGDRPPSPTYFSKRETERFDRVYVRGGGGRALACVEHHVEHYRVGRRALPVLSDHLPVEVELELDVTAGA